MENIMDMGENIMRMVEYYIVENGKMVKLMEKG